MKSFKQYTLETNLEEQTAGQTGKDHHYAGDADYSAHDPAKERHLQSASKHIMKHDEAGKYKVNHSFGGGQYAGKKHAKPDVTLHYSGDAEGDYDHHSYTVHHDGAAANDKKLHKPAIHEK